MEQDFTTESSIESILAFALTLICLLPQGPPRHPQCRRVETGFHFPRGNTVLRSDQAIDRCLSETDRNPANCSGWETKGVVI